MVVTNATSSGHRHSTFDVKEGETRLTCKLARGCMSDTVMPSFHFNCLFPTKTMSHGRLLPQSAQMRAARAPQRLCEACYNQVEAQHAELRVAVAAFVLLLTWQDLHPLPRLLRECANHVQGITEAELDRLTSSGDALTLQMVSESSCSQLTQQQLLLADSLSRQ